MRVMNSILCATLLLLGANLAAAPDLPTYAVTDLKALGIWPISMNERGDLYGRETSVAPGGSRAPGPPHTYLFSAGFVTELFPPTVAPNVTIPMLLNDAGHVFFATDTYTHWWVYDGASYRRIEPPAPADAHYPLRDFGISASNAAGQIVGVALYGPDTYPYPSFSLAWLDDGGVMQMLNPLGARSCSVQGLNNWGDVALMCLFDSSTEPTYKSVLGVRYRDGSWREIEDRIVQFVGLNDSRAVLVERGSVPSYLFDDAGAHVIDPICDEGSSNCDAWVRNLNDRGEVVGSSIFTTSTPQLPQVGSVSRALLWRNGLSADISPPGNGNSEATEINNHGVAVGQYINEAGKNRPFIYASGTSMDLAELRGVGAALDLTLAESNWPVVRIADSGHILVSSYMLDSSRKTTVWNGAHLLTPVVPTLSLTPSDTAVQVGTPVTLTWSSQNANYCVAGGGSSGDGWAGDRATSGQATLTSNAPATVQYSIRCSAGPVSGDSKVSVAFNLVPPDDSHKRKSGGGGYVDVLVVLGLAGLGLGRRRKAA
jgi:hypothetical protein